MQEWSLSFPLLSAVLEARVRQLQAESTSKVRLKKTEQPAQEHSSRWAQKLETEKHVKQKRRDKFFNPEKQALVLIKEPVIWSRKLASCLPHSKKEAPKSSQEEHLAQALQAILRKLSSQHIGPKDRVKAKAVDPQILLLQQKLLTFFQCCACTGHLPLAYHVLATHHSIREKQLLLTLDMYNAVMLGWARKVRPLSSCLLPDKSL